MRTYSYFFIMPRSNILEDSYNNAISGLSATNVQSAIDELAASYSSININDQSSSGYLDIGNTRIQWGKLSVNGTATITFPQPFGDTSYSFVGTSGGAVGQQNTIGILGSITTTSIDVVHNSNNTGSGNGLVCWQAIGVKP